MLCAPSSLGHRKAALHIGSMVNEKTLDWKPLNVYVNNCPLHILRAGTGALFQLSLFMPKGVLRALLSTFHDCLNEVKIRAVMANCQRHEPE